MEFAIKEEFYLEGKPQKIISGAIHYFRVTPGKWRQSLQNLKALGANTVETYIPWNLHEPHPGVFNFSGIADLESFLKLATEMDLNIILRPSPYICAEWDFGGLPAWLLTRCRKVRSQDPAYLAAVAAYYQVLLPKLVPFQATHGGRVVMMQLENEYGSYCDDHDFLRFHLQLMRKNGIDLPIVTSDGSWDVMLTAGSLIEEGILPTANFGSNALDNFNALATFMEDHHFKGPLMCMEFWDGWFNSWGKPIVKRNPQEVATEVKNILARGSINLYMFHGGTNFGFWNGANYDEENGYTPQVTSYDYDALLDEAGNPTEKFYAVQKVIADYLPKDCQLPPVITSEAVDYPTISSKEKCGLMENLTNISTKAVRDMCYPMEEFAQNQGYLLYETYLPASATSQELTLIDFNDRAQIFYQGEKIATFDEKSPKTTFTIQPKDGEPLRILVENRGRINYGPKLIDASQAKGIKGGVKFASHFISQWGHYPIALTDLSGLDFRQTSADGLPSFTKFSWQIPADQLADTYLDLSEWGKGCVVINGFNLGRFWNCGPFYSLYLPADLLMVGTNELIIFETEGITSSQLKFSKIPLKDISQS